jgi:hypothetical protein
MIRFSRPRASGATSRLRTLTLLLVALSVGLTGCSSSSAGQSIAQTAPSETAAPPTVAAATTSPTSLVRAASAAVKATTESDAAAAFVAPKALGRGDGSSRKNAADLRRLNQLIKRAEPGDTIELASGVYQVHQSISLSGGGAPGAPITIRGAAGGQSPMLVGTRAHPYDPAADPGLPLFRLGVGANHLVFTNLECQNIGNGCFVVTAPISGLLISSIDATNVRRFFEHAAKAGVGDASINGLEISSVNVRGFSKGAIRIRYDSHDIRISDVFGDSQRQDGDDFAIGVHLLDKVHDVLIERVTMNNARDTLHAYWNGDGFAAESGVHDLRIINTSASGNTDAGYDIKAKNVTMIDAEAADNKRNFRLWGSEVVLEDCHGTDPRLRGGTGTQVQVHAPDHAEVELIGCSFIDSDEDTIVFQVDDQAHLVVRDTAVERSGDGVMSLVAADATIQLVRVVEVIR